MRKMAHVSTADLNFMRCVRGCVQLTGRKSNPNIYNF